MTMKPIPMDFRRALEQHGLWDYFTEGAFVHRAAYLSWIAEARTPRTRRLKIADALLRLEAQRQDVLREATAAMRRSA